MIRINTSFHASGDDAPYGFRCVVPLAASLGVANNAGSHRPANPALPISADHASSNIKLQAEEQTRIWNNYAMALIRLKDCRIKH